MSLARSKDRLTGALELLCLTLIVFAVPLNTARALDNPPPADPAQAVSPHPTQDPGVKKLSRREKKQRMRLLDARYHDFLTRVEPIMLPDELDAFLLLDTNAQRDLYVDKFWGIRDINPATTRNEYRETYDQLMTEAKAKFSRLLSDQARIYLARGRPTAIHSVGPCDRYLQPIEVWEYSYLPFLRGPALLVFYLPRDARESQPPSLWVPESDDMFENLGALLSPTGGKIGPREIFQTALETGAQNRISWECPGGDRLLVAIRWILMHRLETRAMFNPPNLETETMDRAMNSTLVENPEAPRFDAEFTVAHPGKRGSRTASQITMAVPSDELTTKELGGSSFFNVDLVGEILHQGRFVENFRYRFDYPAKSVKGEIPIVVERLLTPGDYTFRIKLTDVNSGAESVMVHDIEVPYVAEEIAVIEEKTASHSADLLTQEYRTGESRIRIVPVADEMATGFRRVETIISGDDIAAVEFWVDGRKIMTKRRPPFEFDLNLGEVPMAHRVKVVGLDRRGDVIAGDEAEFNAGSDPFRVHIVTPRVIGKIEGPVRVEVDASAPAGRNIAKVELFLNETHLATLYNRPWIQTIEIPSGLELAYLRAVATIDDERGSKAEDLVYLIRPEFLEEVDVHLVELPTTVYIKGNPADSLTKDDFKVFDEREPVEIAKFDHVGDLPLSIGIAVDCSGSMKYRMTDAQKAAAQFLANVLRPGDRGFVVAFDEETRVVQRWTERLTDLTAALASLRAEESTALFDAVVYSLYNFQGMRGQKALILLSDGEDTASTYAYTQAIDYARRSAVPIYTIGINIRAAAGDIRSKLSRLSDETGGQYFDITYGAEMGRIYDNIEEQLRSQYILGFYPPPEAKPGEGWRRVRVVVKGGQARTISGYYP